MTQRLKPAFDVGLAAGQRAWLRKTPIERIWEEAAQHARAFANGRQPATPRERARLILDYGKAFLDMAYNYHPDPDSRELQWVKRW